MPFAAIAELEGSPAHEMFSNSSSIKRVGSLLLLLRALEMVSGLKDVVGKGISAAGMESLGWLFCSAVVSGIPVSRPMLLK